jgi:HTH-type transcriptional regulator / antitoxin HipB
MMSQAIPRRSHLAEARPARIDRPGVTAAYEQARLRYELAEVVRVRREELGWSQRRLAERAGINQSGVARFEAGGATLTLELLERLAHALGLTLTVKLGPEAEPRVISDRTTVGLPEDLVHRVGAGGDDRA